MNFKAAQRRGLPRVFRASLALGMTWAWSGAALAQPVVTSLGVIPLGGFSVGVGVSSNGGVIAAFGNGPSPRRGFQWSNNTRTDLGLLSGGWYTQASAVNAAGTVIVGFGGSTAGDQAFRWTATGGPEPLGLLRDGFDSFAMDISGDGGVIVGFAGTESGDQAFRWTSATGMQGLTGLPGGTQSLAMGISDDGSTMVGYADHSGRWRAVRWVSGVAENLGVLSGGDVSLAYAASGDGRVVVGSGNSSQGIRAFRWLDGAGMFSLGVVAGSNASYATDVSADGSVVVGYCNTPDGNLASMWSPATGLVDLNTFLPTLGTDLTGWMLFQALAVSADGSAMTGFGFFNGQPRGWVVTGLGGCAGATILTEPVAVTVCLGGDAIFTVLGQGTGPLSYSWRKGGAPIDVMTNPTAATANLTITGATTSDAGEYDCIVSNACGTDTSAAAALVICAPDFNCSGVVSVQDIFDFLAAYFANDPRADFNASGAISVQDIFDFLAAYFTGC